MNKKDEFSITVFTTVYNNYGIFLHQWIENIKKQTIKVNKIVIVLGLNHGADIDNLKKLLEGYEYEFVFYDKSACMGLLRNLAIDKIDTTWRLYFSVDDELLPNAIEEIYNKSKDNDAVTLKYIDEKPGRTSIERESAHYNMDNIKRWVGLYPVPGYIANKNKINGEVIRYESHDIPNYPFLFMLAYMEINIDHTDNICAIYHRRPNSHGDKAQKNNKYKIFKRTLDARMNYYIDLYKKENKEKVLDK